MEFKASEQGTTNDLSSNLTLVFFCLDDFIDECETIVNATRLSSTVRSRG